jgi:hypothetical protein
VWSRRAGDADGTRVVLFNDDGGRRVVNLRPSSLPAPVTRFGLQDGSVGEPFEVAGALSITLEPGEVVCLCLGEGPLAVPDTRVLDTGWTLSAGDISGAVDVYRGWERQGAGDFSGVGEYRTVFEMRGEALEWPEWELILPDVRTSAEAELNGRAVGRWGWGPFRCAVGQGVLRSGRNELRIKVASTAANSYYAHSAHRAGPAEPSGLVRPPRLRPRLGAGGGESCA